MNLREFKGLTQYSTRRIAEVIGCSYSAAQTNVLRGTYLTKPEHKKRYEKVLKLEKLIRSNPKDRLILIYKWEKFTGIDWKE